MPTPLPQSPVRAPQVAGEAKQPPSINGIQLLPHTCWKFQSPKGCDGACLWPYTHGCYYCGAEYAPKDCHMMGGGSNPPPPKQHSPFLPLKLLESQSGQQEEQIGTTGQHLVRQIMVGQRAPNKNGHPLNTNLSVSLHGKMTGASLHNWIKCGREERLDQCWT